MEYDPITQGDYPELALLTNAGRTALYMVPWSAAILCDVPKGNEELKRTWKAWSGFLLDSAYKLTVRNETLYAVGEIGNMIYESDKWSGKLERYEHTTNLRPAPLLYVDSKKRKITGVRTWGVLDKKGRKLIDSRGLIF